MRILFYIEPVIYQRDALFLSPHCNFVRCIINANGDPGVTYALATSPWLIREYLAQVEAHGGTADIEFFEIDPVALLAPFDFETRDYSRDMFGDTLVNGLMLSALRDLRRSFDADVVICGTDNPYIRQVFADRLVLHHDLSHIRRRDGQYNTFLDGCGLSATSVLNVAKAEILSENVASEVLTSLTLRHTDMVFNSAGASEKRSAFQAWRKQKGLADTGMALVALQHADLLGVEGSYKGKSASGILMSSISALPPGWVGVASYHPDDPSLRGVAPHLADCMDQMVQPPLELFSHGSDPLVPAFDAVVTVSSKVGLMGLLAGKPVVSLGQSAYHRYCVRDAKDLNDAPTLNAADIGRLIRFMSNRYYWTFSELFQSNGFVLSALRNMSRYASVKDYHLDFSTWSPDRLERLA